MGNDKLASGIIGCDLRQYRNNVFVRETVEPVAAHPPFCQRARQSEALGERRLRLMKRRIETSNLPHLGCGQGDRADRGNVVRLMQRSERRKRLQCRDNPRVD
jgi:hypothetical protein